MATPQSPVNVIVPAGNWSFSKVLLVGADVRLLGAAGSTLSALNPVRLTHHTHTFAYHSFSHRNRIDPVGAGPSSGALGGRPQWGIVPHDHISECGVTAVHSRGTLDYYIHSWTRSPLTLCMRTDLSSLKPTDGCR
eukprot:COSAG03_NODE_2196_length_3017_cov_9.821796_1_plen_135_part_10